jgi:hypothetical protein
MGFSEDIKNLEEPQEPQEQQEPQDKVVRDKPEGKSACAPRAPRSTEVTTDMCPNE